MESGHLSSGHSLGLRPGLIDLEDVHMVPQEQIAGVWPYVAPWLAAACARSHGDMTMERALADCLSGRQQLFVATAQGIPTAAATVAVMPKPFGNLLLIALCGGRDLWTWRDAMLEAFIQWGNTLGCVRMRIIGRTGWAKVAGFRPVATVMERSL